MRWSPADLGYCSNVHPTNSLADLQRVICHHVSRVAALRGLASACSGLWLSSDLAARLDTDAADMARFQGWLKDQGVRLVTLNGFPFENFHLQQVKERVYRPDWSQPARLEYTVQLARILAACLAEDVGEGTISTLPLGFSVGWNESRQAAARDKLHRLVAALRGIKRQTGRQIRVCLEMEPGCVLEATPELIDFFTRDLPSGAAEAGLSPGDLSAHLGVCYDVCHQAVMHESATDSLAQIAQAGITVGKIQVSSALRADSPRDPQTRRELEAYAEPRYLHQVRTVDAQGNRHGRMDLAEALSDDDFPADSAWRVHFHVPIQAAGLEGSLGTTRGDILEVLDFLRANPASHPHIEVETYTWEVLPEEFRPLDEEQLNQGLAAELNWLSTEMAKRGLLKEAAV